MAEQTVCSSTHILLRRSVFKISILPIVKILSALFVHLFFVFFITIILFALFGYYPDLYTLQVIYYSVLPVYICVGIIICYMFNCYLFQRFRTDNFNYSSGWCVDDTYYVAGDDGGRRQQMDFEIKSDLLYRKWLQRSVD